MSGPLTRMLKRGFYRNIAHTIRCRSLSFNGNRFRLGLRVDVRGFSLIYSNKGDLFKNLVWFGCYFLLIAEPSWKSFAQLWMLSFLLWFSVYSCFPASRLHFPSFETDFSSEVCWLMICNRSREPSWLMNILTLISAYSLTITPGWLCDLDKWERSTMNEW